MSCTAAFFATKQDARDTQRELSRRLGFATNLRFCEEHDGFHVIGNTRRIKVHPKALTALHLMAQGFTMSEIARDTGSTVRQVRTYYQALRWAFGALSLGHLVATAVAIGVISPNEFIAPIIELGGNSARQNGERARTRGSGAAYECSSNGESAAVASQGVA